jgi:hypothetical protein
LGVVRILRHVFRAVRIAAKDERIPRWLRSLAAVGLLPIPGPVDEAVLLVAAIPLALFYRRPLREAWQRSRAGDGVPGLTVKSVRLRTKRSRSALALAESFGAPVFEPTWWPEDTGKVSYRLDGASYWIGSTRRGGTPIGVVGKAEKPELRLPVGNWSPIPELETMRGLISKSGEHFRAVVHQEQQTIHLIGYVSEAELVQAVKSFQRVPAESS